MSTRDKPYREGIAARLTRLEEGQAQIIEELDVLHALLETVAQHVAQRRATPKPAPSKNFVNPEDIPESLAPFPRWWQTDRLTPQQADAQVRFVAKWGDLLKVWVATYGDDMRPGSVVQAHLAEAYAWEEANEQNRKTPTGRPKFLNGWLQRAHDRAPSRNGNNVDEGHNARLFRELNR